MSFSSAASLADPSDDRVTAKLVSHAFMTPKGSADTTSWLAEGVGVKEGVEEPDPLES